MHPAIERAKKAGWTSLLEPEAVEVLKSYGLPLVESRFARTVDEALQAADQIGFPVVLKVVSPGILHKSDAGGVKVNLQKGSQVSAAFEEILSNARAYDPQAEVHGVLVSKFVPGGLEVVVGLTEDVEFGRVIMFGLGGIFVEVLKDVVFRRIPLREEDARATVREIKGWPLLSGVRGKTPLNVKALEELLVGVSRLALAEPDIKEMDLNPVLVREDGAVIVDARVLV